MRVIIREERRTYMQNNARTFRNNFISGTLILIPVATIVWLSIFVINTLGGVRNILPSSISDSSNPLVRFLSSIIVLSIIIVLITVFGWLSRKLVGKQFISFIEETIARIPVLRSTYKAIKQIIDVFSGKNEQFKAVCLVEFPRKGTKSFAFITGETIFEGKKHFYVFVPTTPNPTSGFTIILEQEEVIRVNVTVEEAFKTIISMGTLSSKIEPMEKNSSL